MWGVAAACLLGWSYVAVAYFSGWLPFALVSEAFIPIHAWFLAMGVVSAWGAGLGRLHLARQAALSTVPPASLALALICLNSSYQWSIIPGIIPLALLTAAVSIAAQCAERPLISVRRALREASGPLPVSEQPAPT